MIPSMVAIKNNSIEAWQGKVNLVAINSKGKTTLKNNKIETTSAILGDINIKEKSAIDVSGDGAGSVNILADDLIIDDSVITAITYGNKDGGKVTINANNIELKNGPAISGITYDSGKAVDVNIKANQNIKLYGDNGRVSSSLSVSTQSSENDAGKGGDINLIANNIDIKDGAFIDSTTWGKGKGGDISIVATNNINFSGENSLGETTRLQGGAVYSENDAGNSGNLKIIGENISFKNGAIIVMPVDGSAKGGDVEIKANNNLEFSGTNKDGSIKSSLSTYTDGSGDSSSLFLTGNNILFDNKAFINAGTYSTGKAGDLKIVAKNNLKLDREAYINSETKNSGEGGAINLTAKSLDLDNKAYISSESKLDKKGGDAGSIKIDTSDYIKIRNNSYLTTEALDAGGGGITANTVNKLFLSLLLLLLLLEGLSSLK